MEEYDFKPYLGSGSASGEMRVFSSIGTLEPCRTRPCLNLGRWLRRTRNHAFLIPLLLFTAIFSQGEASAARLNLTWTDNSEDEDGFEIERRTLTTAFTGIAVAGINIHFYIDSGLLGGMTYCYRVRAFNADGYSEYSNEACATTAATLTMTQLGNGTVTSSPIGINCPADCSEGYVSGTIVSLTAIPALGFGFTGWSGGGCNGAGICMLSVNGDTSVTATFTPNAVNVAPAAMFGLNTTTPRTGETLTATAITVDADGDMVTLTYVWKVNGVVRKTTLGSSNPTDSFDLSVAANGNKDDVITVEVTPNDGTVNGATVVVVATVQNGAPVAINDFYFVFEGNTLTVESPGVLMNDIDPEENTLTAVLASSVSNGILSLNTDGSFNYIPNINFTGTDSFTYRANDGGVDGEVATVTITVGPFTARLVTQNDTYNTAVSTTLTTDNPGVLGNDNDFDGKAMTVVLVRSTSNGMLTLNVDGSFTYTPNANFAGTDSFTYTANNGAIDSNFGMVTIRVSPDNTELVAKNDNHSVNEEATLNVAAPGVLDNDTEADGTSLMAMLVSGPLFGTLTLNVDGSFNYTPNVNFTGTDSFSYRTSDGVVDSNAATVTITVNGINDKPVAISQSVTTEEDTPKTIILNGSDIDSLSLSFSIISGPTNGSLEPISGPSCVSSGAGSMCTATVVYVPDVNFNGTDSLAFKVSDNSLESNVATVTIMVSAVNDGPMATVSLDTTTPQTNDTLTATATRADTDGDTVTLTYYWKVNGAVKKTTFGSSSLIDSFDLSLPGNGRRGDVIQVEVTPNDGMANGATVSASATVVSQ